jgi:hypothetical protein
MDGFTPQGHLRWIRTAAGESAIIRNFATIRVECPVRHSFKRAEASLCGADGLVCILAVVNLEDPLNDLELMPIRTQQILEETHSVASNRPAKPGYCCMEWPLRY